MNLTIDNATLPITEWAADYGIPVSLIRSRLRRGWSEERAITEPMVVRRGEKLEADAMIDLPPKPRPIVPAVIAPLRTTSPRIANPLPRGGRRPGKAPMFVTHKGERRSVRAWAERFGISNQAMHARLRADPERAFRTEPTCTGQRLTFDGQSLTVAEWAKRNHLSEFTIHGRLRRGWPVDRALGTSARQKDHLIHCHGQAHTMREWAKLLGLTVSAIRARIRSGWPLERTLGQAKAGG